MIVVKIIWALVLSGLLGYCYVRAGRWERTSGKTESVFGDEVEKETYAFIPASCFIIVFIMFAALSYAFRGGDGLLECAVFFLSSALQVFTWELLPMSASED